MHESHRSFGECPLTESAEVLVAGGDVIDALGGGKLDGVSREGGGEGELHGDDRVLGDGDMLCPDLCGWAGHRQPHHRSGVSRSEKR